MAKQVIGRGTTANDGTGDPLRDAFDKVNDNFTELYVSGSTAKTTIVDADSIGGVNSESSSIPARWTWANIKAWLWASPTFTTLVNLCKTVLGAVSFQLGPATLSDGQWSGITEPGTAGATLAFGDLCYQYSDGKWKLAKADAATTSGGVRLGFCVLAGTANAATEILLSPGRIRADSKFPTLPVGQVCYVSSATAGAIVAGAAGATTGQPSATDSVTRVVGYGSANAKELIVEIEHTYLTHV